MSEVTCYERTMDELGPIPEQNKDRASWFYWCGWLDHLRGYPIDHLITHSIAMHVVRKDEDKVWYKQGWLDSEGHHE